MQQIIYHLAEKTTNMEININMTIEREVLENIFVTALEGGSNYWYDIPDKEIAKVRKAVPREEEEALSMAIFKAVFDKGVRVAIHDAENPEDELGILSYDLIKDRLNEIGLDKHNSKFLVAEMQENGDAETSDAIFQLLTMGEITFG
jgi:hypothetical protein